MTGDAREPVRRAERGSDRSRPSNLIRVMPAQGAEMMSNSLTIVGAGVIGLSCAWRAAQTGVAVTVLDPAPASGALWVAGGMLAPVTEAWPGEEELLELGLAAVARWPRFAEELVTAAGRQAGLRTEGTVV